jgi:hypothetical protein
MRAYTCMCGCACVCVRGGGGERLLGDCICERNTVSQIPLTVSLTLKKVLRVSVGKGGTLDPLKLLNISVKSEGEILFSTTGKTSSRTRGWCGFGCMYVCMYAVSKVVRE